MDTSPHWPLAATAPLALFLACALGAYWWRLGLPDIPSRRRRLRRAANVVMGLLLAAFVIGMSVANPVESRGLYVTIWLVASLLIMLLLGLAGLDTVQNLRQHADSECRATSDAAKMLLAELRKAEESTTGEERSRDD